MRITQTQTLSIIQLLASLGNPSEDNKCNFARCIVQNQTLSIIPILAFLGNPIKDNNCNFARVSLTEIFYKSILLTNWREQPKTC